MDESRDHSLVLQNAKPSVLQTNGFRMLRLPTDTPPRLLKKRASEVRLLLEVPDDEELRIRPLFPFDRILLPERLTLDDIRGIEQRLQDSRSRLLEEYFWFWPAAGQQGRDDSALAAIAAGETATAVSMWSKSERVHGLESRVACHNLSVYYYACVLNHEAYLISGQPPSPKREEVLDAVAPLWENCLRRWDSIIKTDGEWEILRNRVELLADPSLDVGFVDAIRDTLPQALDKVNAELAVAFADRGDGDSVARHVAFITQTQSELDDATRTLTDATREQRERIRAVVADMTRRTSAEPARGGDVILRSLASVKHDALIVQLVLGSCEARSKDGAKRRRERRTLQTDLSDTLDQIADGAIDCQIGYARATDDWEKSLAVLQEAKQYAMSEKVRDRLYDNLKTVEGNRAHAETQTFWLKLEEQIERTAVTPSVRLVAFKERALPIVRQALVDPAKPPALREGIGDAAAAFLRKLSLTANNSFGDAEAAVSILDQAIDVVQDQELRASLSDDRELLRTRIVNAPSSTVSYRHNQLVSDEEWDAIWEMVGNALQRSPEVWYKAAAQLLPAGKRVLMSVGWGQKSREVLESLPKPTRSSLPKVLPYIWPAFDYLARPGMDLEVDPTRLECNGKACSFGDVTGFSGGFPTAALRTFGDSTITIDFRRLCLGFDRGDDVTRQLVTALARRRANTVLNALSSFVLPQLTRRVVYAVLEGTPHQLVPRDGPRLLVTREYVEYADPGPSLWRRKPPIRIPLGDVACLVKDGTVTVRKNGDSGIPVFTCKVSGTWNALIIDDAITMVRDYIHENNITFESAPDTRTRRTT